MISSRPYRSFSTPWYDIHSVPPSALILPSRSAKPRHPISDHGPNPSMIVFSCPIRPVPLRSSRLPLIPPRSFLLPPLLLLPHCKRVPLSLTLSINPRNLPGCKTMRAKQSICSARIRIRILSHRIGAGPAEVVVHGRVPSLSLSL